MRAARTSAPEALIPGAPRAPCGQGSIHARWIVTAAVALLAACATLPPPGANYPKEASHAIEKPESTPLGGEIAKAARTHPGLSAFRLLPIGAEGLKARADLAEAAQRSLDLQYFIIQNDVTGKLLMDAVLRAADRGVRVRMLIDDTDDVGKNKQIVALAAHPKIEIRIFNPFYTRGPFNLLRWSEYLVDQRLNYRMHNKVFVADNAAAVLGGRNIGDEYFGPNPRIEFVDFDVLTLGPISQRISRTFDNYWNSDLAIPAQALLDTKPSEAALQTYRADLEQNRREHASDAHRPKLGVADPIHALLDGDGALVWAKADVLYDNPDKIKVEAGEKRGPLLRNRLVQAIDAVNQEILIVSPYLVPGDEGMRIVEGLRKKSVTVRIITNSLASTDLPAVHSGYVHYRTRLLEDGVELYEVRPSPEATDDRGHNLKPSEGQFALHAKVFVFDRKQLFVGSMNFDYRSLKLNTEIGVLIDSPELALQAAKRFDSIAQPANCYIPHLSPPDALGHRQLVWRTEENGRAVELATEPAGNLSRGLQANLLSLLPLDDLL
jgi:putative cardiolipin synthase